LQEALKLKNNKKRKNKGNVVFFNFDDFPPSPIVIRIPPLFYLSIRLEGWIVNNCMIDTKAAITVIPKVVTNEMKLYIN